MNLLPLFIITPLAAAFVTVLLGRRIAAIGEPLSLIATAILGAASVPVAASAAASNVIIASIGSFPPSLGIPMAVDSLSALLLVTVNGIAFLVAIYAAVYARRYADTWKYHALFLSLVAGMNGVLLAADIFNLYVWLEVAALAAYALVAFGTEAEELEAAFKYAVMGSIGSIFIVMGIIFTYSYTSTLSFADIARTVAENRGSNVILFTTALFIMGFGLKSALAPFHAWLPDAHTSAPTPISAMLSGVVIKVLGIYALGRIIFGVFGMGEAVQPVVIACAVLSMVAAGILAFGQTDIKRLLAYSSISQMGYIALGLGLGTELGIIGAIFHLVNHSAAKSLLFLGAGAIERVSGTRDLRKITAITARAPLTGYATLAGMLSICGIPPFGGFWSKVIIIVACVQAGRPSLAFIAAIASVLTIAYYGKALTPVLFGASPAGAPAGISQKVPAAMQAAMAVLALVVVVSGLFLLPGAGQAFLRDAALHLMSGSYAALIPGVVR